MDRIKGSRLLLAVSVLGLLLLTGLVFPDKKLSAYSVSEQTWEQLCAGREPTQEALLAELTFNDYALWTDGTTGRYFYSLIENDPRAYDPPVRWRGSSAGVHLAVRNAAITPGTIAAGEPLQVMAYDQASYRIYTVACTTLPLFSLDYGYDGGEAGLDGWVGEGMYVRLFDNRASASQRLQDMPGVVHERGNGTLRYPKKSYRLTTLDESLGDHLREADTALLGLRKDGDWILYAAYNDQERVRNVFSANLWKKNCAKHNVFGIDNGMEYQYVELFFGGEYWGLYALGYPLDIRQMELRQDPEGNYEEYFYRTFWWTVKDFYELLSLGSDDTAAMLALDNYLTDLTESRDSRTLYADADIGNAIDLYLFYNLIQGSDHVFGPHSNAPDSETYYNTYLGMKQTPTGPKFYYTPWDMDTTWGNCVDGGGPNFMGEYGVAPSDNYLMETNPVSKLQELDDPEINELVRQRYAELRQNGWSNRSVTAMLDELETDIFDSGAYVRDVARWPQSNREPPGNRLTKFKDYVTQRLAYMDAFVQALP